MRIPVTIVTGFLGAGKTSLVRHLVTHGERRIALLINEFGELGIDRELLLGCTSCGESDVIELANGCICCTVAEDFLPALTRLLERPAPLDHIVIETSGLALPKPLLQAFQWPEVKSRVTVDGVLAVIDASDFLARPRASGGPGPTHVARSSVSAAAGTTEQPDDPIEEVFGDQLAASDLVILNTVDLVDAARAASLEAQLAARLRPGVRLVRAVQGAVPPLLALGFGAAAEDDLAARPSCHDGEPSHNHDDFESFVLALGPVADPAAFVARVGAAMARHGILRLKGFLDVPGLAFRHVVQAVGPRVERHFDRPWRAGEERLSRLVVIGLKGIDRAAVAAALGS